MVLFHKELIKKTAPSHTPNPSKFFSVTTYSRAHRTHTSITSTGTLGRKERKKVKCKVKWHILEAFKKRIKKNQTGNTHSRARGTNTSSLTRETTSSLEAEIFPMRSRIANSRKSPRHHLPFSNF